MTRREREEGRAFLPLNGVGPGTLSIRQLLAARALKRAKAKRRNQGK